MKHLLLTTIAAVLWVGCGKPEDIWRAAQQGNIEAVKRHLAAGANVECEGCWRESKKADSVQRDLLRFAV